MKHSNSHFNQASTRQDITNHPASSKVNKPSNPQIIRHTTIYTRQKKKRIQWYRAQIYITPLFLRSTFFLVPKGQGGRGANKTVIGRSLPTVFFP
jgi:hypothetical protein